MKWLWLNDLFDRIAPRTIKGRFTLVFLLLSLTPIAVIGVVAYQNSRASLATEIANKLDAVADNKTYILKSWLKRISRTRRGSPAMKLSRISSRQASAWCIPTSRRNPTRRERAGLKISLRRCRRRILPTSTS